MDVLKLIGRKLAHCGWAAASFGVGYKCPVCFCGGYDPRTQSTGLVADIKTRERCPLCVGTGIVPGLDMGRVQRGTHPRQRDIEEILAEREARRKAVSQTKDVS